MHSKKKGLSDVVTVVLTVMITIAAIGIVWAAVVPLIRENLIDSSVCNDVDISVDVLGGFTCFDSTNNVTLVQIKKGNSNVNITALKFYVVSNGNSLGFFNDSVPNKNEVKSYYLNNSGFSSIEKIRIIPITNNGQTETECKEVSTNKIENCDLTVDIADIQSGGQGGSSGSGYLISPGVNSGKFFVCQKNTTTTYNDYITGTCSHQCPPGFSFSSCYLCNWNQYGQQFCNNCAKTETNQTSCSASPSCDINNGFVKISESSCYY